MAINTGKVIVGGIAAGVVLAALDFLINGVLMAEQNMAALNALNPLLAETADSASTAVAFIVIDLLFGLLLVWTYAALRPRFGPGPKTAALAGVQIWLVSLLMYVGMAFMGMWPWSYVAIGALAFLAVIVIAALVGGKIYQEA